MTRPAADLARGLPIEPELPGLRGALAGAVRAVLVAPPGAGKTTIVPLALLDAAWLGDQRIVMLSPRRVAARAAARRMATLLHEAPGETVGWRMRSDTRIGPTTRIEVVTEGVLTRMVQADPALEGVGLVVFDEFHERSLNADLGLALCLEAQDAVRPDLRVLVMSATLDAAPVVRLMGDAPVIASEGRAFPVRTLYADRRPAGPIEPAVAAAVERALAEETGSILAFLPGEREIRRVADLLAAGGADPDVRVEPLYGNLPPEAQDRAIAPAPPGVRKVVLATAIAETSLTIEGVRVVVDGGLARAPRFDPASGLTRLETVRVSQAAADQRRGRAGRTEPGVCYRLWPEAEHGALARQDRPEIVSADLAGLALELAAWGASDPAGLRWLDPPPAGAWAQARALLTRLGGLDASGRITAQGAAMAQLGAHPRLAAMMLRGRAARIGGVACAIAALLGERDILRRTGGARDADVRLRLEAMDAPDGGALPEGLALDRGAARQAKVTAQQWQRALGVRRERGDAERAGLALAFAYPDRIGRRRGGAPGQFLLSGGRGATLPPADALAAAEFLVVADLDAGDRDARIHLAAPVNIDELSASCPELIETVAAVSWDARSRGVLARRRRMLGALVLGDEPLADADPAAIAAALLEGVRALGASALPWTPEAEALRVRVAFLARIEAAPGGWPDWSDASLLATAGDWLAPWLGGVAKLDDLRRLDLRRILHERLTPPQRSALERLAPTHLAVPSGARLPVDYAGDAPVLAARLQQMLGCTRQPAVADGRVPVLLHLLSPAGRPIQVTRDIAGFWAGSYREVRREMLGRYPKHPWPEDPAAAAATDRAKPRK
ncbi:MAG: ATP-dependent helicase HrpB [Rhodospirillaceae bacterium]